MRIQEEVNMKTYSMIIYVMTTITISRDGLMKN